MTDLNGVLTGYTHTVGAESLVNPTGAIVVGADGYLPGCGLRLSPRADDWHGGDWRHGMVGHPTRTACAIRASWGLRAWTVEFEEPGGDGNLDDGDGRERQTICLRTWRRGRTT